jgi:uncharacterized protein (TIGR01777 family)
VLVSASAVGYYGVRDDAPLDESAASGTDFPATLCRAWEREALEAHALGARVVVLRLGLVLGPGGVLARLLPVFRAGLGAPFGSGRQWMPWIHLEDAVAAILHALDATDMHGPVNAVAPEQVRNRAFSHALAQVLGRPLWPGIPGWALRAVLGEMATVLLDGQRVVPAQLHQQGWKFRFPTLAAALADQTCTPHRRSAAAKRMSHA